jgi:hypothetical protein
MGSPALIDAQADQILAQLNATAAWLNNHVTGGVLTNGGTTQASGAATAPNVDIDTSQIVDAVITGTPTELAAQVDADPTAGDQINWGATSGKEAIGAAVLSRGVADDTPAVEVVFGDVAAVGDAVAPTDAEITSFLGHSNWSRIATFRLERTADTAITFDSIDHTVRASQYGFEGDLAVTESEFANGGVTRVFPIVQDPPPSV